MDKSRNYLVWCYQTQHGFSNKHYVPSAFIPFERQLLSFCTPCVHPCSSPASGEKRMVSLGSSPGINSASRAVQQDCTWIRLCHWGVTLSLALKTRSCTSSAGLQQLLGAARTYYNAEGKGLPECTPGGHSRCFPILGLSLMERRSGLHRNCPRNAVT